MTICWRFGTAACIAVIDQWAMAYGGYLGLAIIACLRAEMQAINPARNTPAKAPARLRKT